MCTQNNTNCGCQDDPCGCKINSDEIVYQGPALTCLGVENCDTLTEVFEKIDALVCSPAFTQTIVNNIINTPQLLEQFTTIVNTNLNCETVWDCINATTTTTTTLVCTCIEIVADADDLANATGNSNGELDNVLFLSSPNSGVVLCDGGTITNAFNAEGASKFCITASYFPLLQLYYFRQDVIVSGAGNLSSTLTNLSQDCSVNADCDEATTTTTTTIP